eukprot:TRINITY_DN12303_c0_g1_i2.p1 TRINITY_DN12303_c0_g1~~TRINITY_DN12303_c0_g1_i2.p1  ORF type:complete len:353 (+),score=90.17 TRINITY_DN12303_c0_g1_i2:210-1268(+)
MQPKVFEMAPQQLQARKSLTEHLNHLDALRQGRLPSAPIPRPPDGPRVAVRGASVQISETERSNMDRVLRRGSDGASGWAWSRVAETMTRNGDTARLRQHLLQLDEIQLVALRQSKRNMLHFAAKAGHIGPCVLLIAEFAFVPDMVWPGEGTALHVAAANGHYHIVDYLLTYPDGTSGLNTPDPLTGNMPLHRAAEVGRVAVLRLLCTAGAVLDPVNKKGMTPFMSACSEGHGDAARALLAENLELIDVNKCDSNHISPVYHCIRNGDVALLQDLVEAGATLHEPSMYWEPVTFAARNAPLQRALDVVKHLVEVQGLVPDSRDGRQQTPLSCAERRDAHDLVQYLRPLTRRI